MVGEFAPIMLRPLFKAESVNAPRAIPNAFPTPPLSATPPRIADEAACSIRLVPSVADAVAKLRDNKEPATAEISPERANTKTSENVTRAPAASAALRLLPVA